MSGLSVDGPLSIRVRRNDFFDFESVISFIHEHSPGRVSAPGSERLSRF
ncbi:MAG: hypothetical protein ABIN56_04230 [Dokdonella sp.]